MGRHWTHVRGCHRMISSGALKSLTQSATFALFQTMMTVSGIYHKITGKVGVFQRIGQNTPSIFDGVRVLDYFLNESSSFCSGAFGHEQPGRS